MLLVGTIAFSIYLNQSMLQVLIQTFYSTLIEGFVLEGISEFTDSTEPEPLLDEMSSEGSNV